MIVKANHREDSFGPFVFPNTVMIRSDSLNRTTSTTTRIRSTSLSHSESLKTSINIVNTNYDHYGRSIVKNSISILGSKKPSYQNFSSTRSELGKLQGSSPGTSSIPRLSKDQQRAKDGRSKVSYRSLLLQSDHKAIKKLFNKLDQADIFRSSSSISYSRSNNGTPVTINTLPIEILCLIIDYTDDHHSQVTCLYINKSFYEATKPLVYNSPLLRSTYRVAQLLTSIQENPSNGGLIKNLDLSKLEMGAIITDNSNQNLETDDNEFLHGVETLDYAYASWRDWKYKGDPLYGSNFLNSYTLSKSKSTLSVNSLSVSTHSNRSRLIDKLRTSRINTELNSMSSLNKIKEILKLKLKYKKRPRSFSDSIINNRGTKKSTSNTKSVSFKVSNHKFQPFLLKHPYTNKFLLKYANSKDLPIGYVLQFIELCPNITELNISSITLSSDHKIMYPDKNRKKHRLGASLVEEVLFMSSNNSSQVHAPSTTQYSHIPKYLSDSNVYFNVNTFSNEFKLLTETDILKSIMMHLPQLEVLIMASISWLNFKNIQDIFIKNESSLIKNRFNNGDSSNQLIIDLTNSGMMKNMRWATKYDNIKDFIEMFSKTQEQMHELDLNPVEAFHDAMIRNFGMNY